MRLPGLTRVTGTYHKKRWEIVSAFEELMANYAALKDPFRATAAQ